MKRKRRKRCPYCHQLFWPNRKTAWRQWACSDPACQEKRRKDTQKRYRGNHRGEGQARRYREEVARVKSGLHRGVAAGVKPGIFRSLLWDEIEDEISPQQCVTIRYLVELATASLRDEIVSQVSVIKEEYSSYANALEKDEIGDSGASP